MKFCTIKASGRLAVSQRSELGSAGCESPPVCGLKPLQAYEGGAQLQLWPRPRHFNRLTLLTTVSKALKHAGKCPSALCQLWSEKCTLQALTACRCFSYCWLHLMESGTIKTKVFIYLLMSRWHVFTMHTIQFNICVSLLGVFFFMMAFQLYDQSRCKLLLLRLMAVISITLPSF